MVDRFVVLYWIKLGFCTECGISDFLPHPMKLTATDRRAESIFAFVLLTLLSCSVFPVGHVTYVSYGYECGLGASGLKGVPVPPERASVDLEKCAILDLIVFGVTVPLRSPPHLAFS